MQSADGWHDVEEWLKTCQEGMKSMVSFGALVSGIGIALDGLLSTKGKLEIMDVSGFEDGL